jgi:hypothetical protein
MNRIRNSAIAILLVFAFSLMGCAAKHPTDKVLMTDFEAHKAEFNQLVQMFLADKKLFRVSYYATYPENPSEIGVSQQRIQEYRELLHKLDLREGMGGASDKNMVWFSASTFGLNIADTNKGFAYVAKEPSLIVDNLDGYRSKDGKACTAFRHIEGNWYLYLDIGD